MTEQGITEILLSQRQWRKGNDQLPNPEEQCGCGISCIRRSETENESIQDHQRALIIMEQRS